MIEETTKREHEEEEEAWSFWPGSAGLLLGALMFGLIAGGGVYFWQRQVAGQNSQILEAELNTARREITNLEGQLAEKPPMTDMMGEMMGEMMERSANFQTYQDKTAGFEISYPEGYEAVPEPANQAVVIKAKQNRGQYVLTIVDNPLGFDLSKYAAFDSLLNNSPASDSKVKGALSQTQNEIVAGGVKGIENQAVKPDEARERSVFFPLKTKKILNIRYRLDNREADFQNNQQAFDDYLKNGNALISNFRIISP